MSPYRQTAYVEREPSWCWGCKTTIGVITRDDINYCRDCLQGEFNFQATWSLLSRDFPGFWMHTPNGIKRILAEDLWPRGLWPRGKKPV